MKIWLDDAICIALCQRGLRDRMLHYLWIPVLFIVSFGIMVFAAEQDVLGIRVWAILSGFLIGCILVRFSYLFLKSSKLVERLQALGTQEIDLQLGTAQAWGGSVYLLNDYVFAPQYFLLVPYAEIEKVRVKTWKGIIGWVVVDVQLIFCCGWKRYKTMLKKPQEFDPKRFEGALQCRMLAAQNRRQS